QFFQRIIPRSWSAIPRPARLSHVLYATNSGQKNYEAFSENPTIAKKIRVSRQKLVSGNNGAGFLRPLSCGALQIPVDRPRRLAPCSHGKNHGCAAGHDVAAGKDTLLRGREGVIVRRDISAL